MKALIVCLVLAAGGLVALYFIGTKDEKNALAAQVQAESYRLRLLEQEAVIEGLPDSNGGSLIDTANYQYHLHPRSEVEDETRNEVRP